VIGFETNMVEVAIDNAGNQKMFLASESQQEPLPLRFRNCVRVVSHLRLYSATSASSLRIISASSSLSTKSSSLRVDTALSSSMRMMSSFCSSLIASADCLDGVNGQFTVWSRSGWPDPTHVILVQTTIGMTQKLSGVFGFPFELRTPFLQMVQLRIVTLAGGLQISFVRFGL
jgi:hypothetical protein